MVASTLKKLVGLEAASPVARQRELIARVNEQYQAAYKPVAIHSEMIGQISLKVQALQQLGKRPEDIAAEVMEEQREADEYARRHAKDFERAEELRRQLADESARIANVQWDVLNAEITGRCAEQLKAAAEAYAVALTEFVAHAAAMDSLQLVRDEYVTRFQMLSGLPWLMDVPTSNNVPALLHVGRRIDLTAGIEARKAEILAEVRGH